MGIPKRLEEKVRSGKATIFRDGIGGVKELEATSTEELQARIQSLENEEEAIYQERLRYETEFYKRRR